MLDAGVAATFQDIQKPNDVGLGVGMRVLKRVPHACLGREVDNPVRTIPPTPKEISYMASSGLAYLRIKDLYSRQYT